MPPPLAAAAGRSQRSGSSSAAYGGLCEIQPGRLEIALESDQVWRQASSDRYPLAIGHEVRIYLTRFGSDSRLTAPVLRGFVQVERVR